MKSSVFRRWEIDTARPRPKRFNSHVIQFSCHVLANTLGVCTRIILGSGQEGAETGTDTTFISITQVLVEIACEPG